MAIKRQITGTLNLGTCLGHCPIERGEPRDVYQKFASQVQRIAPFNPEYQYIRFRAIGNLEIDGPNNNWDGFPYEDFEDETPGFGYKSFIGKNAFVEHNSHSVENSIGELPGAFLNEFRMPPQFEGKRYAELDSFESPERQQVLSMEDQTDGSIEVLMGIDQELAPRISRMIEQGQHLACSMGTNIEYSLCTACGNKAHFEHEYCQHIKWGKGSTHIVPASDYRALVESRVIRPEWLPKILATSRDVDIVLGNTSARGRQMVTARSYEINRKLSFFELSIVGNPAYFKGQMLERVASTEDGTIRLVNIDDLSDHALALLALRNSDITKLSCKTIEWLNDTLGETPCRCGR